MEDSARATKRQEAWEFARAAVRAYERDQTLSSARQVELAMRLLRETQGSGPRADQL